MKKILVTGGCGYIGTHTVVDLMDNGFEVISIDNLSRADGSLIAGIKKITGKTLKNYEVDLCNEAATLSVFDENPDIVGVIHFAAYKSVPESVDHPLMYFRNNMNALFNMLTGVKKHGIRNFVFSSSCSVYGDIEKLPVTESTPLPEAESPYARTKQIGEQVIKDFAKVNPGNFILLRYFNPVGAHPSAHIGEVPFQNKPDNLVPYITQTALGKLKQLTVFGDD